MKCQKEVVLGWLRLNRQGLILPDGSPGIKYQGGNVLELGYLHKEKSAKDRSLFVLRGVCHHRATKMTTKNIGQCCLQLEKLERTWDLLRFEDSFFGWFLFHSLSEEG